MDTQTDKQGEIELHESQISLTQTDRSSKTQLAEAKLSSDSKHDEPLCSNQALIETIITHIEGNKKRKRTSELSLAQPTKRPKNFEFPEDSS